MTTTHHHQARHGAALTAAAEAHALQTHWYRAIAFFFLDPCEATYTQVACMVATAREAMRMQGVRDFDTQIRSIQRALDVIFDRWEATNLVVALQAEKDTIRAAAEHIAQALAAASSRSLQAAHDIAKAELSVQGINVDDLPSLR
ncbi:hypothetical protein CURE108131_25015 [Cupriavidus respiraculi]|uniref:KfrA N-terminal DNA-binding domain-containing protein n=1 Tax=Cupriavidus respiraculi TaxID=195930 RepID=A0ABM8XV10_9BURK|nr:hypothetical protein [Cupriavidus respiraculi]CAG9184185.1 hypothetical protein LMG21510_05034 [Cupriavidus respiraculi]